MYLEAGSKGVEVVAGCKIVKYIENGEWQHFLFNLMLFLRCFIFSMSKSSAEERDENRLQMSFIHCTHCITHFFRFFQILINNQQTQKNTRKIIYVPFSPLLVKSAIQVKIR